MGSSNSHDERRGKNNALRDKELMGSQRLLTGQHPSCVEQQRIHDAENQDSYDVKTNEIPLERKHKDYED